jgi:formylglycine-generating enzyme required for sulfatase activity
MPTRTGRNGCIAGLSPSTSTWFTNVRPYLLTADAERALKPKDIFQECTDCPAMVVVPSGSFTMGSPDDPKSERNFAGPQREVTIAEPFAVGKYEVTVAEWDACVAALGCPRLTDEEWGRGERPAINLTWDEAQRYTTWLTKLMGRPYRLLSETEWEYAARAGTTTLFSFGDDEAVLGESASYHGNSDLKTHPVGEKKPNGFGLYDMHGNVWEWVQDCWHDSYDGAPTDGSAWTTGYDCGDRVLRGGSFGERDGNLASAERYWFPTNSRATNFGFRVARTLTP